MYTLVHVGLNALRIAAAAATCGAENEVPWTIPKPHELALVPPTHVVVSPVWSVTVVPGAANSTLAPAAENDPKLSFWSVAETAMAASKVAG